MLDGRRFPDGALATKGVTMKRGPAKDFAFCACVFLDGTLLEKVKCRVYDRRPAVCRTAMVPGEKACLNLRKLYERGLLDAEKNVG